MVEKLLEPFHCLTARFYGYYDSYCGTSQFELYIKCSGHCLDKYLFFTFDNALLTIDITLAKSGIVQASCLKYK